MSFSREKAPVLYAAPEPIQPSPQRSRLTIIGFLSLALILTSLTLISGISWQPQTRKSSFFYNVTKIQGICTDEAHSPVSHAGHIGLEGDTTDSPKRSFFWYFEAENDPETAPVILTIGGGPGTSAMMNALWGQSPCLATENGLIFNPHRWTERHNLIALDHPIGAGWSYGSTVNNSRSAAEDVYDFLQKFFVLFPHLAGNKFVVSGGSYGGVYVPNIATVIHEQNIALATTPSRSHNNVHINLDALILSNPATNPMAHWTWLLHYRCVSHNLYNSTDCTRLYAKLPSCQESLDMAFTVPTRENRVAALELCSQLNMGDMHGVNTEDIRETCIDPESPEGCHPEFSWVKKIFDHPLMREILGLSMPDLNFTSLNMEVNAEFGAEGDLARPHHLLYPPLISAGIRLLHYVGAQDANCAWPGVLSFLKLLNTPFQSDFLAAPDVPWPTKDVATVRTVGNCAGSMAYIIVEEAGHFTVKDQPALAKTIVEHWVANEPFF